MIKSIIMVLCFVCVISLCACDGQINVNIGPKESQIQSAQAMDMSASPASTDRADPLFSEETMPTHTPNPSNEGAQTPISTETDSPDTSSSINTTTAEFPCIDAIKEIESLCEELSVIDRESSSGSWVEIYDVNSIAYSCVNGKFYVSYDDHLKRNACFYLKDNKIDDYRIRECVPYLSGWLAFTEIVSADEIPEDCLLIPGYEEFDKANLMYFMSGEGIIERVYAVPYTKGMEGHYLYAPRVLGEYICVYADYEESILLDPENGAVVNTGNMSANEIIALNGDIVLYEQSVADGERRVQILDHAGREIGDVTVSSFLSVRTASDGNIYMTRDVEEKDIIIDDRSYPIYFLSDEYDFKEVAEKNKIYNIVTEKLREHAEGDIQYHIDSLDLDVLSANQCRVLCGVTIFEGEEIRSLCSYILLNIEI